MSDHLEIMLRLDHLHKMAHANAEKVTQVLVLLSDVQSQLGIIMASEQQALDILKKIDTATTAQGAAQQADADALQKISDDLDKIVALGVGGITDSTLAALQKTADNVQALSDAADKNAAFSKSLAAKADNAIPLPVPVPTPLPPVVIP